MINNILSRLLCVTLIISIISSCFKKEGINVCDPDEVLNYPSISIDSISDYNEEFRVSLNIQSIGNVNGDGLISYGICWSTSNDFSNSSSCVELGQRNQEGRIGVNIPKPQSGFFFLRAYAINCAENVFSEIVKTPGVNHGNSPNFILVDSLTLIAGDTNNNGVANPSEFITYNITLENNGGVVGKNVNISISESASAVSGLFPSTLELGDISGSNIKTGQINFDVTYDATPGTKVVFNLEVNCDNCSGAFYSQFTLEIGDYLQPILSFYSFELLGTGNIYAGDVFILKGRIRNDESAESTATSVRVDFDSKNENLTCPTDVFYSSISSGETEVEELVFSLSADQEFNASIPVIVDITAKNNYFTTDTFVIDVKGSKVLPPEPIVHYDFDNGLATTNNAIHNGIINNTINSTNTVTGAGKSMYFDCQSYIDIPNLDLSTFGDFTFSFWMNSYISGNRVLLATSNNIEESVFFEVELVYIRPRIAEVTFQGLTHIIDINTELTEGQWHMVTYTSPNIVAGGGTDKFYVDGVLKKEYDDIFNRGISFGNLLRLGALHGFSNSYNFIGYLDNIRIYDYVLSDFQIAQLYNEEGPQVDIPYSFEIPDGLFQFFDFEEQSLENRTIDLEGGLNGKNANNLTFSNSSLSAESQYSIELNGDSYFEVEKNLFPFLEAFSLNVWIKSTNGVNNYLVGTSDNGDGIFFENNKLFINQLELDLDLANTQLLDGEWHMLTITKDKSFVMLFIDAYSVESCFNCGILNFSEDFPLRIGASLNGGNQGFIGELDNLRIYNRVITRPEMDIIFNSKQ